MTTRASYRAPLAVLLAIAVVALSTPVAARPGSPGPLSAAALPTNQIIVQYQQSGELGVQAAPQPDAIVAQLSALADAELTYARAGDVPGMHLLALPEALPLDEVEAVARQIAAAPGVAYAEPDTVVTIARTPTDPRYASDMWHLQPLVTSDWHDGNNNYSANLTAAWDVTTGSPSIVTAVIDSGGLLAHEDLAGRTPAGNPGYDLISNSLVGNDGFEGNGIERDADPSDPGDWVTGADNCGAARNSSWHGSHVAGTIGASTNNGKGIAGINWVSPLIHVRVLGKCGGLNSDIAAGIRWAAGLPVAGLPTNPNPARVINMSLGGVGACSVTTQSAINDAVAAGAVILVAAGNSNLDLDEEGNEINPAECANIITVGSTDRDGFRATYSNYGSTVEISAPGGDKDYDPQIMSTINSGTMVPVADAYGAYQGTSMATPHVAGVVSLMLSANPGLTSAQVLSILQSTATPFPDWSYCDTSTCGAGILNGASAVEEAARLARTAGWGATGQSVSEGAGSVTIPVQLSIGSSKIVTLPYTVSGTAGAGDHTLVAGTITFPVGATSASLSLAIADDPAEEGNETIVVTLGTPSGSPAPAAITTSTAHTITLVDNDGAAPTTTLSLDGVTALQGASGLTVNFRVRRGGASVAAGVSYTVRAVGGSAPLAEGQVSLGAAESTKNVSVTLDRGQLGSAAALQVQLSAPTGGAVLGQQSSVQADVTRAHYVFLPLQAR